MQNTVTPVSATSGTVTVLLVPLAGHPGYWIQNQTEDGDAFGDEMTVHLEDETPQDYAQRWATLYAS